MPYIMPDVEPGWVWSFAPDGSVRIVLNHCGQPSRVDKEDTVRLSDVVVAHANVCVSCGARTHVRGFVFFVPDAQEISP